MKKEKLSQKQCENLVGKIIWWLDEDDGSIQNVVFSGMIQKYDEWDCLCVGPKEEPERHTISCEEEFFLSSQDLIKHLFKNTKRISCSNRVLVLSKETKSK